MPPCADREIIEYLCAIFAVWLENKAERETCKNCQSFYFLEKTDILEFFHHYQWDEHQCPQRDRPAMVYWLNNAGPSYLAAHLGSYEGWILAPEQFPCIRRVSDGFMSVRH